MVPPTEWLILLAQVDAIPSDIRATYILNLALIAYPYAQYLFAYAEDLQMARVAYVAVGRQDSVAARKEKRRWMKQFRRTHRERRIEVADKLDGLHMRIWEGWTWAIDWKVPGSEAEARGWSVVELDIERAGVPAQRSFPPFPAGTGVPTSNAERTESKGKGKAKEKGEGDGYAGTGEIVNVVGFEVETIVLSLLDRLEVSSLPPPGSTFRTVRFDRLRQLVHLALALVRANASGPLSTSPNARGLLELVRDRLMSVREALTADEREWLELEGEYMWDIGEVSKGLKEWGISAEGLDGWSAGQG